ncbi:unnamed protein product, partial [Gulo gulo]
GLRRRPPPQSLAEKREKPPRTDRAYTRGPDSEPPLRHLMKAGR